MVGGSVRSGWRRRPPALRALVANPAVGLQTALVVSTGISGFVFGLSYLLAYSSGLGDAYLGAISVYLVFVGISGGIVALLWAASAHHELWERVQPCFDVDDGTYQAIVEPLLERAYSGTRITIEFLALLAVVFAWNVGLGNPIPYAIWLPGYVPSNHVLLAVGPGVDVLSVINYLYGFVGLFVAVAGAHGVRYYLLLTRRVLDLPLRDVETAPERLEPVARLGISVATATFLGAGLLMLVYARLVSMATGVASLAFVAQYATFVLVALAAIIAVGLLVFWLPQITIHDALTEAKHARLQALSTEYDALLEACRDEDGSPDYLSTQLDLLNARRDHVTSIDTWSYNLPSLLPVLGSGLATTITWLLSVTNQLSNLLF